jgi:ABC-type uncharacterized transport system substrate-binding protein
MINALLIILNIIQNKEKRMRKKQSLVFALLLLCTWATHAFAAGGKNLKIALITWRGQTDGEKGFKDGLKELGYEVTYQEFDAQQDMTRLSTILKTELDPKQFDYLYTFGTSASVRVSKEYNEEVSHIFNIVNFPVETGLVKSLEAPGRNISGASNYIPIEKQMPILNQIFKVKKLGIVYNPREKNAEVSLEAIKKIAPQYGYTLEIHRIAPETDTLKEFLEGVEKGEITADVFHLISDSYLISQSEAITSALTKVKIPTFSPVEEIVKKKGGLVGLVTSYYELGKGAASVVDQHQKGKPLAEIPVALSSLTLMINKKVADTLEIQFDPAAIKGAQWVE